MLVKGEFLYLRYLPSPFSRSECIQVSISMFPSQQQNQAAVPYEDSKVMTIHLCWRKKSKFNQLRHNNNYLRILSPCNKIACLSKAGAIQVNKWRVVSISNYCQKKMKSPLVNFPSLLHQSREINSISLYTEKKKIKEQTYCIFLRTNVTRNKC